MTPFDPCFSLRTLLAACSVLLLPACGAQRAAPTHAPGAGASQARAERHLPRSLDALESAAEDAYDYALDGRDAELAAEARSIGVRWRSLRAEVSSAGASNRVLQAMDTAVRGLAEALHQGAEPLIVARATNAISAPMDELFSLYDTTVPSAVLELDYLGREVALDARQANFDDSEGHLVQLERVFRSVRTAALERHGQQEVADFAESIGAMRAASGAHDAAQLETAANAELELVDGLERVFAGDGRDPDEAEEDED